MHTSPASPRVGGRYKCGQRRLEVKVVDPGNRHGREIQGILSYPGVPGALEQPYSTTLRSFADLWEEDL